MPAAPRSRETPEPLHVVPVPGHGCEDVLVAPDGTVHTGTEDGSVWALSPDGDRVRRVGRVPGRPMGIELLPDGRLLVCDADHGLLALDPAGGGTEPLLSRVAGQPLVLTNNAAVAKDGTIWFSESSRVHPLTRWRADLVEDTRTGRLLRRDPGGDVEVVLDGLRFANGVALAPDEAFVCVAESPGRAVVRHWLSGDRAGRTDHLARELPGYLDNLALGTDGLVWVPIASPPNRTLERVVTFPKAVRRAVTRVPERLLPGPERTARVQAYDLDGRLVHDRVLDATSFHMVTGVREHHGRVWLGSLVEPAVAWFDL
jgi:sugar lactone lactonase YvrE